MTRYSPKKLNLLTQIECDYLSTMLIKQLEITNEVSKKDYIDLKQTFDRSKLTIEALEENMVKPEIQNTIFFHSYREVNLTNVVKLLLRASQLYEARSTTTKILTATTEIE